MEGRRKIVLAFDSFKGTLSSIEAASITKSAILAASPDALVETVAVADGGEGTVDAIIARLGGDFISLMATGPDGTSVNARYGLSGETAVIETAAASGLTLLPPDQRNPLLTTSRGTGELISDAIAKGCREFLIGLGGSATNDAGTGMLSALGYRFLDAQGQEVGDGGGNVGRICKIDVSEVIPELKECHFTVACDVTNPLTGADGASRVFGPQKGADSAMVDLLDRNLRSFARVVATLIGKDLSGEAGAGAAGGLGFSFKAFLNADLKPGIEMLLDAINFDTILHDASLVITGEGSIDRQTLMGKAPYGIMRRARRHGIPVIAIGGRVDEAAVGPLKAAGFTEIYSLTAGRNPLPEDLTPTGATHNLTALLNTFPLINAVSDPTFGY